MSTTPDNSNQQEQAQEWGLFPQAIKQFTAQRDRLAKVLKMYEADEAEGIDPAHEMRTAKGILQKVLPDQSISNSNAPVDMSVRDLLGDYWNQVATRKNTATTSFKLLDDALSGGFEPQRLVGLLGAPNCGKTTFAHQMADFIADSGRPVLYVTSEDTPSALLAKTLARTGKIKYTAVLKGWESEKANINAALAGQLDRVSSDRLRYLDAIGGVGLDVIRDKALAHFELFSDPDKKGGPGVLVIDYLQRLTRSIKVRSGQGGDLRETVTMITERLRSLACELNCTVIAITAQNRASYNRSDNGAIASAKESGDIEYTCDVLIALTEDKDKNRISPLGQMPILLHIDKNRQGRRGQPVALNFWPDYQQFTQVGE